MAQHFVLRPITQVIYDQSLKQKMAGFILSVIDPPLVNT